MKNLSVCGVAAKYLIFGFNIIIFIFGFIIFVMGCVGVANDDYGNISEFDDVGGHHAASVMVLLFGLASMFFSFFGCLGAIRESKALLMLYSVLVGFALLLIFIAAIVAFVFKGSAEETLEDVMQKEIDRVVDGKQETSKVFDLLQKEGHCCGIHNYTDWKEAPVFPVSCCKDQEKCDCLTTSDDCWDEGCLDKFIDNIRDSAGAIGTIGMLFCLILLAAILLACWVGCSV